MALPDCLFSAYQGKGTRKSILTRIMVSRSEIDMKRIKDEYKKTYGKTLYQDILVSKHLITDNDNRPMLDVRFFVVYICFFFLSG